MPPRIYLLSPPDEPFLDDLEDILEEGLAYFQYRRPGLSDARRYEELVDLANLVDDYPTELIVNNRPDLARSVDADGVHLGDQDLPVSAVKDRWPDMVVGRTHRVSDQLTEGADYYGIGPVFSSFTKNLEVEPCGWEGIREVTERTTKPIYAIGGIEVSRVDGIPRELDGVCVLGAVWDHPDPIAALKSLRERLQS